MGKGDKKSKKGKIFMGSYGNSRLRKGHSATAAVAAAPKTVKKAEKKTKKA